MIQLEGWHILPPPPTVSLRWDLLSSYQPLKVTLPFDIYWTLDKPHPTFHWVECVRSDLNIVLIWYLTVKPRVYLKKYLAMTIDLHWPLLSLSSVDYTEMRPGLWTILSSSFINPHADRCSDYKSYIPTNKQTALIQK